MKKPEARGTFSGLQRAWGGERLRQRVTQFEGEAGVTGISASQNQMGLEQVRQMALLSLKGTGGWPLVCVFIFLFITSVAACSAGRPGVQHWCSEHNFLSALCLTVFVCV